MKVTTLVPLVHPVSDFTKVHSIISILAKTPTKMMLPKLSKLKIISYNLRCQVSIIWVRIFYKKKDHSIFYRQSEKWSWTCVSCSVSKGDSLFLADATLWNLNNKHTENVRLSDPTFTLLFNCYLNQE